jgi:hypothetical protein
VEPLRKTSLDQYTAYTTDAAATTTTTIVISTAYQDSITAPYPVI